MKKILSVILATVMLCSVLTCGITSASVGSEFPFTDVSANPKAWYYDAVEYVWKNGLMNGSSNSTFEPNTDMSRAMFITVLGRLCGAKSTSKDTFPDTDKNTWYSEYVGWASEIGIMKGDGNGNFRPNAPITRQEAAVCVSRLMEYLDVMFDYTDVSPDEYEDNDTIAADWALEHVDSLSRYGIIEGDNNGNFKPVNKLDRAQGATILMRLHKKYLDATETSIALNVWDFFNTPEQLVTNMNSAKNETTVLPSMDLTPCSSDYAPWFFGVNITYSDIPAGGLEYVKFSFKTTDGAKDPYLMISSPIHEAKLSPVAVAAEGEYTTLIFETGDASREIRAKLFTEKEEFMQTGQASMKNDVDLPTLNTRYLYVSLYPFGDNSNVTANVSYVGFFSDLEAAMAYTAQSEADVYKNGKDVYATADIRDLTDAVTKQYTDAMNVRIDEIVNTPNTYSPSDIKGTCYYVSSINGKPGNDGLSPETPFASIKDLYTVYANDGDFIIHKVKPGDAVFFERGSVFHKTLESGNSGDYVMLTKDGVIYSTYGEGPKPIFTGCLDINGSMDWVKTEHKNVWMLNDDFVTKSQNPTMGYHDVGNIVVTDKTGKTGFGIRVAVNNANGNVFYDGATTIDNGLVTTGFEVYDSASRPAESLATVLMHNLEYYHDWETNKLYMYYDGGNPGEVFEKIIVSTKGHCIGLASNAVLDNVSVMYTGSHGITAGYINSVIQNCTIEWIGGSAQGGTTRFGNGVEIYGSSDGYTINNCYVNQVYDGGISTQISTPASENTIALQNNLTFSNNVITNTNSHIEIWNYGVGSVLCNIRLTGNYLAVGGYHFGHQRPNKGGSLLYLGRFTGQFYSNSVFEDNVLMFAHAMICGRPLLARGETNGTVMRNNVYINSSNTRLGELQADWRNDNVGGDAVDHAQMYTRENIQNMVDNGIEEGTVFYITDEYYDEREADGLFYNRGGNFRGH